MRACVVSIVIGIVVAACSKGEPKGAPPPSSSVKGPPSIATSAPLAPSPITSTTPGPSGKLPDTWPSDVPTYPGAKLGASELGARGASVSMTTKDAPEKVVTFYETSLRMPKTNDVGRGPIKTVSFQDDKRSVTVMAMSMAEATQVTVTVLAK